MNNRYSPRERVRIALDHQEPDRVPCDLTIAPDAYQELCEFTGIAYEPYWWDDNNHAYPSIEMLEKLNVDVMHVPVDFTPDGFSIEQERVTDPFGITKKKVIGEDGSFSYVMVTNPLAGAESVEDIQNYKWPAPEDLLDFSRAGEVIKDCWKNTDFALTTYIGGHIFEGAHFLRGMESMLVDFYVDPDIPCAIMDKMLEIDLKFDALFLSEFGKYLTYIRFNGEDIGTQNGPMISPEMFDKFIRPRLEMEWRHAKQEFIKENPHGKVGIHSCGSVYDFIGRFADMGADILNPVQPNAAGMDTKKIKKEFGKRICFHGGVETQSLLTRGTVEDIREEVRLRLKHLAPGGGYICAPSHNVQYGMSPESIIALYEAIHEYGEYPIK